MAFLVFEAKGNLGRISALPQETFAGVPNKVSAEEVPYELLLGIHSSTILPDPVGPRPSMSAGNAAVDGSQPLLPKLLCAPARDSSLGVIARRRRSALDFDGGTPPMERSEVEQILDFATRDWPSDWRGNFSGETTAVGQCPNFVTLYLYVHRVRDCEPGVYRWDGSSRGLEQLHRGNVERVAAYLSLEQALAGNACFAVSMVADLAKAAQTFGNRGYRYVHFEAGAIGQRLYLGAEALGWNGTGIGAFYDDDVHRYLGFLDQADGTVGSSLAAAEQATLVMLDSSASRHAAMGDGDTRELASEIPDSDNQFLGGQQLVVNKLEATPCKDSSNLPQQVIYHFAVGRAIPDPRFEV
jgi:SagB-type dehydrogenase family enzyme